MLVKWTVDALEKIPLHTLHVNTYSSYSIKINPNALIESAAPTLVQFDLKGVCLSDLSVREYPRLRRLQIEQLDIGNEIKMPMLESISVTAPLMTDVKIIKMAHKNYPHAELHFMCNDVSLYFNIVVAKVFADDYIRLKLPNDNQTQRAIDAHNRAITLRRFHEESQREGSYLHNLPREVLDVIERFI